MNVKRIEGLRFTAVAIESSKVRRQEKQLPTKRKKHARLRRCVRVGSVRIVLAEPRRKEGWTVSRFLGDNSRMNSTRFFLSLFLTLISHLSGYLNVNSTPEFEMD